MSSSCLGTYTGSVTTSKCERSPLTVEFSEFSRPRNAQRHACPVNPALLKNENDASGLLPKCLRELDRIVNGDRSHFDVRH